MRKGLKRKNRGNKTGKWWENTLFFSWNDKKRGKLLRKVNGGIKILETGKNKNFILKMSKLRHTETSGS